MIQSAVRAVSGLNLYLLLVSNSNGLASFLVNDIGGVNVPAPPSSPGWGLPFVPVPPAGSPIQ